jgi:chromosome segregation ATPase
MSDLESITNNELEDCRKEIERLTGNNIALENELEECDEQLKECKDELKNCQKEIEYLRGGNGIG